MLQRVVFSLFFTPRPTFQRFQDQTLKVGHQGGTLATSQLSNIVIAEGLFEIKQCNNATTKDYRNRRATAAVQDVPEHRNENEHERVRKAIPRRPAASAARRGV